MKNYQRRVCGFLILALAPLSAPLAFAEIYKWVDAEGKVHFGDKPHDSAEAEEVKLKESYRPAERTPQEQETYLREQQLLGRKTQARQQSEQREKVENDEKAAQQGEEKAKLCASYTDYIKRLTTMDVSGPIPKYYYVKENGKSVTSARQREIVAEIKAEMAAAGCP